MPPKKQEGGAFIWGGGRVCVRERGGGWSEPLSDGSVFGRMTGEEKLWLGV